VFKVGESSVMPSFFAKVPFWIWSLLGVLCLALSVPGFLGWQEDKTRLAALNSEIPTLVELKDFDAAVDISPASEVNLFVQTNPDLHFPVDAIGGAGNGAVIVPLFSVYAAPSERSVTHVIFAEDLARFEAWSESNSVGTSRMGALRRTTYGNPLILAGSGLWLIWFGFVIWSRAKALKQSVSRRMGEIGERTSGEDSVNLSRLARTSKNLAGGNVTRIDAHRSGSKPDATPAE